MAQVRLPQSTTALHTPKRVSRSYYGMALKRFLRSPTAITGGVLLLIIVMLSLCAPLIVQHDPLEMRVGKPLSAPSVEFLLGTDQFGRDLLSRILYGGRISLRVGLISVAIGLAGGTVLGLISGFYGGWPDRIISRITDAMLAFPGILLALSIVATLGSSLSNVMIAVGIGFIPSYIRLVRAAVITAKHDVYVLAARCLGASSPAIIVRHLLPNVLAPIIVLSTVSFGTAIISAASLGYLGLGAQPPTPEWGLILNQGRTFMRQAWWISAFPGIFIMLTVLAVNLLGDGLRDALDPRMGD